MNLRTVQLLPTIKKNDSINDDNIDLNSADIIQLSKWWHYLMLFKTKYEFIIDKTAR